MLLLTTVSAVSAAGAAQAQVPPAGVEPPAVPVPDGSADAPEVRAQPSAPEPSVGERAREAVRLPELADRLRAAGVPPAEVTEAIDVLRARGARAHEVADVLEAETDGAATGRPTENFGAFVQERLQEGLRGRDLAQAIRAEHARMGRGHGAGSGDGSGGDGAGAHGRPEAPGASGEHGRPTDPGQAGGEHGRPVEPGEARGEHGRPVEPGEARGEQGRSGQGGPAGGQGRPERDNGPTSRPTNPSRGGGQ